MGRHSSWVHAELEKKSNKNYTPLQLFQIFTERKVDITHFNLVIIGMDNNNERKNIFFRIKSCEKILNGVHEIEYNGQIITVNSLRQLKRSVFNLKDVTSFERCTFIIHEESRKLIRLKNARHLLYYNDTDEVKKSGKEVALDVFIEKNINPIISRFQGQMKKEKMDKVLDSALEEITMFVKKTRKRYIDAEMDILWKSIEDCDDSIFNS